MENNLAKIKCTNPSCHELNSVSERFCSKCRTPIPKLYLWGIGEEAKKFKVGEIIGDRYLVKHPKLFLDTKPSDLPETPEKVPNQILPYLLLFPYYLHIPQVYGLLPNSLNKTIWLLEYNYLPITEGNKQPLPEIFPRLTKAWPEASPLRQLNWLWQIAKLWQPLQTKNVAASLLNPALLKVKGTIIQLQELDLNPGQTPKIGELGKVWSEWIDNADPKIRDFLSKICQNLKTESITQAKELISFLDQATYQIGQQQVRTYQIYTLTDSGPTRNNNEDNCFPSSGKLVEKPEQTIVCDGLGGQEGGEIASLMAIQLLAKDLQSINFLKKSWRPQKNLRWLDRIIREANNQISQRNDREKRQEKRRMGTTLLMAIAQAHEMYLAHIGDSRIYLITKNGAYRITLDDDLASREVRLGYSLYRQALEYPTSGALIQALGMSSSDSLYPTLQRIVIDEDCVFLLCSDGLSDYDRVEEYWETKILPILTEKLTLVQSGNQLVEIANEKNGHDNVTVALIHCQVKSIPQNKLQSTEPSENLDWEKIQESLFLSQSSETDSDLNSDLPTTPILKSSLTSFSTSNKKTASTTTTTSDKKSKVIAISLLVVVLVALFGYLLKDKFPGQLKPNHPPSNDSSSLLQFDLKFLNLKKIQATVFLNS